MQTLFWVASLMKYICILDIVMASCVKEWKNEIVFFKRQHLMNWWRAIRVGGFGSRWLLKGVFFISSCLDLTACCFSVWACNQEVVYTWDARWRQWCAIKCLAGYKEALHCVLKTRVMSGFGALSILLSGVFCKEGAIPCFDVVLKNSQKALTHSQIQINSIIPHGKMCLVFCLVRWCVFKNV